MLFDLVGLLKGLFSASLSVASGLFVGGSGTVRPRDVTDSIDRLTTTLATELRSLQQNALELKMFGDDIEARGHVQKAWEGLRAGTLDLAEIELQKAKRLSPVSAALWIGFSWLHTAKLLSGKLGPSQEADDGRDLERATKLTYAAADLEVMPKAWLLLLLFAMAHQRNHRRGEEFAKERLLSVLESAEEPLSFTDYRLFIAPLVQQEGVTAGSLLPAPLAREVELAFGKEFNSRVLKVTSVDLAQLDECEEVLRNHATEATFWLSPTSREPLERLGPWMEGHRQLRVEHAGRQQELAPALDYIAPWVPQALLIGSVLLLLLAFGLSFSPDDIGCSIVFGLAGLVLLMGSGVKGWEIWIRNWGPRKQIRQLGGHKAFRELRKRVGELETELRASREQRPTLPSTEFKLLT